MKATTCQLWIVSWVNVDIFFYPTLTPSSLFSLSLLLLSYFSLALLFCVFFIVLNPLCLTVDSKWKQNCKREMLLDLKYFSSSTGKVFHWHSSLFSPLILSDRASYSHLLTHFLSLSFSSLKLAFVCFVSTPPILSSHFDWLWFFFSWFSLFFAIIWSILQVDKWHSIFRTGFIHPVNGYVRTGLETKEEKKKKKKRDKSKAILSSFTLSLSLPSPFLSLSLLHWWL